MDAEGALDVRAGCVRRSRVVLMSRCWHYVLEKQKLLWDNGGKRAVLRGEHEVSRKAIAQGRPECFRCTCMLVCISCYAQTAHETSGAASTRSSLRPLIGEGGSFRKASGSSCREIANTHSIVITRLDRTTQYSRDIDA